MAISIEEKIVLAKECGMSSWASDKEQAIKTAKEIATLTNMNFKPFNESEANERLTRFVFNRWNGLGDLRIGVNISLFILVIGAVILSANSLINVKWVFFLSAMAALNTLSGFIGHTIVRKRSLVVWSDNIPYGALLAVKEAKSRGLGDFMVYYPCYDTHERFLADPIITGRRNGVEVEVFYWDDGKVYE